MFLLTYLLTLVPTYNVYLNTQMASCQWLVCQGHVAIYISRIIIIIIIIIITTTIFIVLSTMAPAIRESSLRFIWAKVGQRQVAANSQAKLQTWPSSLPVGCHRPNIRPSPLVLFLNRKVDYSFTVPRRVEGWVDLGTAVSVQPVPKAAYRSDFRENTNFC